MNTLLLRAATLFFLPLSLLFSIFLLLRGHNAPGGGFTAGLVAAGGVALACLNYGPAWGRRLVRFDPRSLMGWGLAISLASGTPAIILGHPFLTGYWWELEIPVIGRMPLGTPLIFDIGVFLLVFAAASIIVLSLAEES